MHAIIVTGGKQYKVAEGETLFIEKLPVEAGDKVVFDQATTPPSAPPVWPAPPWRPTP